LSNYERRLTYHESAFHYHIFSPQGSFRRRIQINKYEGWRTGKGNGANINILQLLTRADSEYKRLMRLQQWTTKNKSSDLLGLQAKFDTLQTQFMALLTKHTKLKNKQQQTNKLTSAPKPEENEEQMVNGEKWYYCSKCMSGRRLDCMTLVMVRIFCLAKNDNYAIT